MAVLKTVVERLMSGEDGGQSQDSPPLELMHVAAAGNTVVGDEYGLFCVYFFLRFSSEGWGGGCKGESRSNASVRWCVGLLPPCSTFCIVNMVAASLSEAQL